MTTTVAECLAHALTEELGLATLAALAHLVAFEKKGALAAAAWTGDVLVTRGARAVVTLERARVATRASFRTRRAAGRDRSETVDTGITREVLERRRTAWASADNTWRSRACERRNAVGVALVLAVVDTAFVRLAADALAGKPSNPLLVSSRALLLGMLLPSARNGLLLVAAIAANRLDLFARGTRAKVTKAIAVVLAASTLTRTRLVTDGSESGIVGASGGALDGQGSAVRRAANDQGNLAWRAWARVAVEWAGMVAVGSHPRAGVVTRVRGSRVGRGL